MASNPLRKEYYSSQPAPATFPPKTQSAKKLQASHAAANQAKERLLLLGALVFVTVAVLFILSRFAAIMVNNYELQNLQANLAAQSAQNASLQAQVDELSSPTRILGYAMGVLKMKPAAPVQVGAGNP